MSLGVLNIRIASIPLAHAARTLILVLSLLLAPGGALAQQGAEQVSVSASIKPERLYVGDTATLEIDIEGGQVDTPPDLSRLVGADVAYLGPQNRSSSSSVYANGRWNTTTSTVTALLYSVRPKAAGKLTIPSMPVNVGGRNVFTQPITVAVLEPTVSTDVSIAVELENSRPFVGEPVAFRIVWTLTRDIRGYSLELPTPDNADIVDGPDPREPGTSSIDPRYIELKVGGASVIATRGNRVINGKNAITVTIDRVLMPKAPGRITLGPIRAYFNTVVGERARSARDWPWDDRSVLEKQTASAPPIEINVRALPTTGRPADFSGLVGKYSVSASAAQTHVSVGDPIDLTVAVRGPHPLSLVPPLDLRAQSIATKFRTPRDPLLPDLDRTSAVFRAQVRARSASSESIPPIELNYFDTEAEAYRIARSSPIPLNIRAADNTDLGALAELDDDQTSTPQSDQPDAASARVGGLAPLDRRPPRMIVGAFDASPDRVLRVGMLSVGGLAVVGTVVHTLRWLSRRNPTRVQRTRAFRAFRRESRVAAGSTDPHRQLTRAVCDYAARISRRPPATLTSGEALAVFRDAAPSVAEQLERTLRTLEARAFGEASAHGARVEHETPAAELQRLIAELHADLLRTPEGGAA